METLRAPRLCFFVLFFSALFDSNKSEIDLSRRADDPRCAKEESVSRVRFSLRFLFNITDWLGEAREQYLLLAYRRMPERHYHKSIESKKKTDTNRFVWSYSNSLYLQATPSGGCARIYLMQCFFRSFSSSNK